MKLNYNEARHLYRLDGRYCKGVTSIASIPDDKYGLRQWDKRQVVAGMALDDRLVERAKAHHDDKTVLQAIAEDAMRAAKSNEASERGTMLHRIIERADKGETQVETPLSRAVIAAWYKALAEAGIEIVPDYVERILVHPVERIAGRMDRFVKVKRSKGVAVLDLKTGKIDYPHSIAVQLALYANALLMAGELDIHGNTEHFDEMPEMNRKHGYIVHLPDPDHVQIVKVDIAAGWDIFTKSIKPILAWRARKDLVTPVASADVIDPEQPATDERVEMVKHRLSLIKGWAELQGNDMGLRITRARWPKAIPMRGPWTEADIDRLDEMLHTIERDASVPF